MLKSIGRPVTLRLRPRPLARPALRLVPCAALDYATACVFLFLRHHASRPLPAKIKPGRPEPTMGAGTPTKVTVDGSAEEIIGGGCCGAVWACSHIRLSHLRIWTVCRQRSRDVRF